jgi:hypothetical protein
MTGKPGLIVIVRAKDPVPEAFVAVTVTLELPFDAGVPEMIPDPVSTLRPAGNPVAPKLVGLPDAVI